MGFKFNDGYNFNGRSMSEILSELDARKEPNPPDIDQALKDRAAKAAAEKLRWSPGRTEQIFVSQTRTSVPPEKKVTPPAPGGRVIDWRD